MHDAGGLPEGKSKDPLLKYLRLRVPLEEGFVVTVEPGYVPSPTLSRSRDPDRELIPRRSADSTLTNTSLRRTRTRSSSTLLCSTSTGMSVACGSRTSAFPSLAAVPERQLMATVTASSSPRMGSRTSLRRPRRLQRSKLSPRLAGPDAAIALDQRTSSRARSPRPNLRRNASITLPN